MRYCKSIVLIIAFIIVQQGVAQRNNFVWTSDGLGYTKIVDGNLVKIDPKKEGQTILIKKEQLTPNSTSKALNPQSYSFSTDNGKLLLFVNTAKVWRYNTRGDYWIFDVAKNQLRQIGKGLPSQSLMFAKFSPNSKLVAYVSEHNIYAEDLETGNIKKLTVDGTRKLINGTVDWV